MKNANRSFFVCISLGLLFLMLFNFANAENRIQPRRNVNLSPFESWRSAYFCMLNHSSACHNTNHIITINGTLNVQDFEINEFCKGGCYDHTILIFKCIDDVKKNFHFATKASVAYVRNLTMNACNIQKGFDASKYKDPNSATSLNGRIYIPIVSTIMTMFFIATFGV